MAGVYRPTPPAIMVGDFRLSDEARSALGRLLDGRIENDSMEALIEAIEEAIAGYKAESQVVPNDAWFPHPQRQRVAGELESVRSKSAALADALVALSTESRDRLTKTIRGDASAESKLNRLRWELLHLAGSCKEAEAKLPLEQRRRGPRPNMAAHALAGECKRILLEFTEVRVTYSGSASPTPWQRFLELVFDYACVPMGTDRLARLLAGGSGSR